MAEEPAQGRPGDGHDPEGEWLPIATAARRLGISPKAIRGRIERRTIVWKQDGNRGRLVLVHPGDGPGAAPEGPRDVPWDGEGEVAAEELAWLRGELAEARITIARLEEQKRAVQAAADEQVKAARAVAEQQVMAARAVAVADVATAQAEHAAQERLIEKLEELLAAEREALADARRPWWRRLFT